MTFEQIKQEVKALGEKLNKECYSYRIDFVKGSQWFEITGGHNNIDDK